MTDDLGDTSMLRPINPTALQPRTGVLRAEAPGGLSRLPRPTEDDTLAENAILARYLAGWAKADAARIADATTHAYRFHDPLVGTFTRQALPQYFALLHERFARVGATRGGDFAFAICGPRIALDRGSVAEYWREGPAIGLTGTTQIDVTGEGVAAEVVAYDLNLASDLLRQGGMWRGTEAGNDNGARPTRLAAAA